MNSMSNYTEAGVLNTLKGTTFVAPQKTYIGLFLSNPTEQATGGVEVSYAGYQRVEVTEWGTPVYDSTAQRTTISNVSEATFAKPSENAGTITHLVVFDSQTGGNRLFYGELEEPILLEAEEVPVIIAGEINFYLTGDMSQEWQKKVLNILNAVNIAGAETHLALFNGNNEIIADNYARIPISFGDVQEQESGVSVIKNSATASFQRANTNWGNYDRYVLVNGATGSDIMWNKTTTIKTVQRLKMVRVDIDGLVVGVN